MEETKSSDSSDDDNEYSLFSSTNRFAGLAAGKKNAKTPAQVFDFNRLQQRQPVAAQKSVSKTTDGGGRRSTRQLQASAIEETSTPAIASASAEGDGILTSTVDNGSGNAPVVASDLPEFLHRYDVHLACSFCHDTGHETVKLLAHVCHYSLFLCRHHVEDQDIDESVDEDHDHDFKKHLKWKAVREFSASRHRLSLCPDRRVCKRGDSCTMAHSEVELDIWAYEQRSGLRCVTSAFRNNLLAATIVGSSKIEILPLPDGENKEMSVWLACPDCATFVRKQYWIIRNWKHECRANFIFLRYDFEPMAQREFWIFLRQSPAASRRRSGFDLCHHIEIGCWRGHFCRFPHTHFEANLWALDKIGLFPLDRFLENVCKRGTPAAEQQWTPKTLVEGTRIRQPTKNVAKSANRTERELEAAAVASVSSLNLNMSSDDVASGSVSRQRFGSAGSGDHPSWRQAQRPPDASSFGRYESKAAKPSNQRQETGQRNSRCPFNIKYICLSCFKNGGAIAYQKGTYCESRNANHTWDQHKGVAIFDSGKVFLVRNLPHSILRARKFGKTVGVRMCHRAEKYKKCTVAECDFAHHDLERRCWMWLLKTGQDLSDVAVSASTTEETEKRAPLPAAAARESNTTSWPPRGSDSGPCRNLGATIAKIVASRPAATARAPVPMVTLKRPALSTARARRLQADLEDELDEEDALYCYLCDKTFEDSESFDAHENTEIHQNRSFIVEKGRVWRYRLPPGQPPFKLCDSHIHGSRCIYSKTEHNRCTHAHSTEELEEWNERLEFLKRALARKANDAMAELQKKISDAKKLGKSILTSCLDDVDISCEGNCEAAMTKKGEEYTWKFSIAATGSLRLQRVILLDHDTAIYFRLLSPFSETQGEEIESGELFADYDLDGLYEVVVNFVGSSTPQTFTQRVAFDFGKLPIVYRELVVHSGLDKMVLAEQAALRNMLKPKNQRWTPENAEIIWISRARSDERMEMSNVVANLNFSINESNYFSLLKQWLFAEEYRRQSIMDEFSLTNVTIVAVDMVVDDDGEILRAPRDDIGLGVIRLEEPLSEDVDIITLLREYCTNAFVSLSKQPPREPGKKRIVYEVDVINTQRFKTQGVFSDRIHLQLSANLVRHMGLNPGSKIMVDIQFNFDSKQFRRWLRGLEHLQQRQLAPLIFPDLLKYYHDYASGKVMANTKQKLLEMPQMIEQWKREHNAEQRDVLGHILSCALDRKAAIPPLVVFGPFGTGKTRTLAAAAATLLTNKEFDHTKILICTHANTTADIYIKLLLQHTQMRPEQLRSILWRVFHKRTIRDYGYFMRLTRDEFGVQRPERLTSAVLRQMRVVICTFEASDKLLKVLEESDEAEEGEQVAFTHIFIDEAAQALELETVLPLCLAKRTTCVVVAGDHHQIRPEVYLPEAKELGRPYLERLYNYYEYQKSSIEKSIPGNLRMNYRIPSILFNKNYRCHPDILSFLSKEFYDDPDCLVPRAERFDNGLFRPLYFVSSEADEQIGKNASVVNEAEAKAVVDQVAYLWYNWPRAWGDTSIGVAVPYLEQANLIKDGLKERNVSIHRDKVDVCRVIQMQGKEYKALVISTVRGRKQIIEAGHGTRAHNLAFLDDPRLINTAMTRAKYTVIVVGDPIVLSTLGPCRDIWYQYISKCGRNKTLLPVTVKWPLLEDKMNKYRLEFANINKEKVVETTSADDLLVKQLTRKTHREMK